MGIDAVARFAASAGGVATVTMMSGLSFHKLCGQSIEFFSRPISIFNREILAFHIAEVVQCPKQRTLQMCNRRGCKIAKTIYS